MTLLVNLVKRIHKSHIVGTSTTAGVELVEVSRLRTPINASAMTIGSTIFHTPGALDRCGMLEHELKHVEQWQRLGTFRFIVTYFSQFAWEWLKLLPRGQFRGIVTRAYYNMPLEKEAYATHPKH